MKRWLLAAAAAAVCTTALASDLVVRNESLWDIHFLYLSASDESSWGPDQLEDDVLHSGGSLTLSGVSCDTYDVRIVDEDGDDCEIHGVELCGDTQWTITDENLLSCQADT